MNKTYITLFLISFFFLSNAYAKDIELKTMASESKKTEYPKKIAPPIFDSTYKEAGSIRNTSEVEDSNSSSAYNTREEESLLKEIEALKKINPPVNNANPTTDNIKQETYEYSNLTFNSVKEEDYTKDKVFNLKVRTGITATIILPKGEDIESVQIGDKNSFLVQVAEKGVLTVVAKKTNHDSSITIIGKNSIYPFYVESLPFDSPDTPTFMFRVRANPYFYDTSEDISPVDSTTNKDSKNYQKYIDYAKDLKIDLSKMNWNYRMRGSIEIAPKKIWNDGMFTYLDFGTSNLDKRIIAIYKVIDGVDVPTNERWFGSVLQVPSIRKLTIKAGNKFTCIEPW